MINENFWQGKRIFLTGHTGFKGSWLSIWLNLLGAQVTGYSLEPPTEPSLFESAHIAKIITSKLGDIRDLESLKNAMIKADPEIVIHLAAQSLVRESYRDPVGTYSTNVMGSVHVLEAVRFCHSVRAVVNVTTDKCYQNKEWMWGYRENERLNGYDPYSNSKSCSELATSAYRNSFFNPDTYGTDHFVAIASARAGNVIGGGDWAKDRLIPDIITSFQNNKIVNIRNPHSIRPWQNVLEPLSGYLLLAENLYGDNGIEFGEGWNFGPYDSSAKTVGWIVEKLCVLWGEGAKYSVDQSLHPHEAQYLKLDISKAINRLDWTPAWSLEESLLQIVHWYKEFRKNEHILSVCQKQIKEFSGKRDFE
ncbi:MAG: CDP-glucose 4,6-dehydratase [Bacteroidetes bacterium]|nr:CDP-glucose 4,6-dehydratase [Bacteroidota bacterium]